MEQHYTLRSLHEDMYAHRIHNYVLFHRGVFVTKNRVLDLEDRIAISINSAGRTLFVNSDDHSKAIWRYIFQRVES